MTGGWRREPLLGLAPFALRRKGLFAATVGAGVGAHLTAVTLAGLSAYLVGGAAAGTRPPVAGIGVALLVLVLAHGVFRWGEMYLAHDLAYRVIADLRVRLFDGIARLAPAWLQGRRTGDLATRALSDAESLEWFYAHTLAAALIAVVVPAASVVALLALAGPIGLLPLPFLVVLAALPWVRARHAFVLGARLRDAQGGLAAEVVDGVQGLRELVAFGADARWGERVDDRTRAVHALARRHAARVGAERAGADACVSVMTAALLLACAAAVAAGTLGAPLLPMVIVLAATAAVPVAELGSVTAEWGRLRAAAGRVREILETPPRITERPGAVAPDVRDAGIVFDDVWFRYAPDAPWALRGVSFAVSPGETVALVGHSGAGKTTCAHLLTRLWDVERGGVRIGGHDVRDLTLDGLRRLVATVPQDPHLFTTSVRDNIRLADPDADDDRVAAAATAASADGFVRALPHGYATVLGERGTTLSGGQRQRLAIARALVRAAPVVITDEAVSQLDTVTEAAVTSAVARLHSGRTVLTIAHRLSTVRRADRVIMLEAGRVVATGTHDELLRDCAPYRELLAQQASPG